MVAENPSTSKTVACRKAGRPSSCSRTRSLHFTLAKSSSGSVMAFCVPNTPRPCRISCFRLGRSQLCQARGRHRGGANEVTRKRAGEIVINASYSTDLCVHDGEQPDGSCSYGGHRDRSVDEGQVSGRVELDCADQGRVPI